jgi:hypothetical protein
MLRGVLARCYAQDAARIEVQELIIACRRGAVNVTNRSVKALLFPWK